MKCPTCGVDSQKWHVRHTTIEVYRLDGTTVKEPVTVAISKIEPPKEKPDTRK